MHPDKCMPARAECRGGSLVVRHADAVQLEDMVVEVGKIQGRVRSRPLVLVPDGNEPTRDPVQGGRRNQERDVVAGQRALHIGLDPHEPDLAEPHESLVVPVLS